MTEADIKIAVYADAIDICKMVRQTYGPMPGAACDSIIAKLQDRIEEILEREGRRVYVEVP